MNTTFTTSPEKKAPDYATTQMEFDSAKLYVKLKRRNRNRNIAQEGDGSPLKPYGKEGRMFDFVTIGESFVGNKECEVYIVHNSSVPQFKPNTILEISCKDMWMGKVIIVDGEKAVFKAIDSSNCRSMQNLFNAIAVATPFVITAILSTPTVAGPAVSLGLAVTAINEATKSR